MLTAWSHPGRCRNDAAFAMLAGAAPIPASSGKTVRYRLNRSGDRQLNRALHTIALSRLRYDRRTRAYADRRRAQGKTDREIRRCLKRYIARQLYRQLEPSPTGLTNHRSVVAGVPLRARRRLRTRSNRTSGTVSPPRDDVGVRGNRASMDLVERGVMTIHPTWPDHLLDLDEWSALPEDPSRRIELAEGVLFAAPRPVARHQRLIMRLASQLDALALGRWQVLPEFEVVVDAAAAATVRVPDLVLGTARARRRQLPHRCRTHGRRRRDPLGREQAPRPRPEAP